MMRAPLLSFVLVLGVAAAVPLVPVVCTSRSESKGDGAATAAGEQPGSVKPLSFYEYGPPEKATDKAMEQIVDAQATPAVTADTDQKSNAEADTATASATEVKKEKSAYPN
ncbi:hypothetical protein SORBI_3005G213000 [Sorghum bicolor]|uniref:Secreted protein n=1 Tax=Sorghum bicolor TaxID=4558 RepID=A0A1B6PTW2_SORBI|nr:hypothetical protein SORBI_3005G213000 [Sorghum bicolor]